MSYKGDLYNLVDIKYLKSLLYKNSNEDRLLLEYLFDTYKSSDKYLRNIALNLTHEFTTSNEIYSLIGVERIEVDNDNNYNLYGSTDMLLSLPFLVYEINSNCFYMQSVINVKFYVEVLGKFSLSIFTSLFKYPYEFDFNYFFKEHNVVYSGDVMYQFMLKNIDIINHYLYINNNDVLENFKSLYLSVDNSCLDFRDSEVCLSFDFNSRTFTPKYVLNKCECFKVYFKSLKVQFLPISNSTLLLEIAKRPDAKELMDLFNYFLSNNIKVVSSVNEQRLLSVFNLLSSCLE